MILYEKIKTTRELKKLHSVSPGVHDAVMSYLNESVGYSKLVLDCLAYHGSLSNKLRDIGLNVVASDIASEQFDCAGVKFVQANFNANLPFGNSTFDCIVLCEAIEHLENPWHLLREMNRILKSGGELILSTPNVLFLLSRFLYFAKGIFLYFNDYEYKKPSHINPLTYNEIELILKETGFEIEDVTGAGHRCPLLATVFLAVVELCASILTTLAFRLWTLLTHQSMPKRNRVLNKTLANSSIIVIKATKK